MIEVTRSAGPCHLVREPVAGTRHLGIPRGGPADRVAFGVAKALAGNPGNEWCLEFALVAPVLVARTTVGCAYAGPPLDLVLESGEGTRVIRVPGSFTWPGGAVLRGGAFQAGIRGYLAFAGGLDPACPAPGSVARVAAGQGLGVAGGMLRSRHLEAGRTWSAPSEELRLLAGSDWTAELGRSLAGPWKVGPECDRMGIRLEGNPVVSGLVADRLSEPVVPGTIQLPGSGLPIILGMDGQTIGGYPRVGHVIDADMDMVGQLRPGDGIGMRLVSLDEACNLGLGRARAERDLLVGIAASGGW